MATAKRKMMVEGVKLEMTPMIDVVFQLLIFFLVTLKQEDILGRLEISRPAPGASKPEEQVKLFEVIVYDNRELGGEGVALQGRQISFRELDRQVARLSSVSKSVSVIIKCHGKSPHSNLMKVLDVCAKYDLKNLAVFSL